MLCYPLRKSLAMVPIYYMPKIVMAPGQVVLGRSSGRAVVPLLPSSTPIVDDFSGILSMTRMSLGLLLGPGQFLTTVDVPEL